MQDAAVRQLQEAFLKALSDDDESSAEVEPDIPPRGAPDESDKSAETEEQQIEDSMDVDTLSQVMSAMDAIEARHSTSDDGSADKADGVDKKEKIAKEAETGNKDKKKEEEEKEEEAENEEDNESLVMTSDCEIAAAIESVSTVNRLGRVRFAELLGKKKRAKPPTVTKKARKAREQAKVIMTRRLSAPRGPYVL